MMGGSVYYEYMGQVGSLYRYKIILKTYINCGPDSQVPYCEDPLNPGIGVYEGPANPMTPTLPLLSQNAPVVFASDTIKPDLPDTCTVGMDVCILECIYTWQVDLPLTFQGYHVYYNRCCRNAQIVNLATPDQFGMSFLAWIPPSLVVNSSPQFTDAPLPYLCSSDTVSFLNTAAEPDGDQMIFSFIDPYNSTTGFSVPNPLDWPIPTVTWQTGYNKNQPFGAGGYAYINANTGLTSYYSPNTGQYVVAVEVKEYRNNNLIGIIRRDLQLLVITCPPNPPPNLSSAGGSGQTEFTVDEGDTVCFPIIFTDSGGDSLFFSADGAILDPLQTNPAATLTNNNFWGDSIVSTQFCWITGCLQGRSFPYLFTASVTDNGCPPKTSNEVYSISVVPFTGPSTITGDNSVCPYESGVAYSTTNVAGITYSWTITGGTQASGGSTNAITVNWGAAGAGKVQVTYTNPLGCTDGPKTLNVTINSPPIANAGTDQSICSGQTVQIGSSPLANHTYSWNPTTGLSSSTAANPNVTLTNGGGGPQSTTYIVTVNSLITGCVNKDTVVVMVYAAATVNAGVDGSVCSGGNYNLSGSIGGVATSATWTTSGTGTFNNPGSLTATYTPSAGDISTGSVTLTLTTNDPSGPCPAVSDAMALTINPGATANAGSDATICSGTTYTLSGSIGGSATTLTWTTSGSGTFDNASSLTATYTPSPSDISMGTVTLTLTTNDPAGPCPAASDAMAITINPAATVNAGSDGGVCQGNVYTLAGSYGGGASSVTWTTSGSGTFGNPNSPTSTYAPSAADITAGTVTLTLTTNDPAGPCPAVSDQMILTVGTAATVNAGSDATICSGTTYTLSGTIGGSATSATWITSGSGTFDNASSLTATYTHSAADVSMGSVTLTLSTNDPSGPCPAVSDAMVLTINPAATVSAGADAAICQGSTYTLTGSFGGGASTVTWTTSGSGTFSNPNSPTATYTPSAADITMGSVTLTLTTNDPSGPCPAVSDQMVLTINQPATVNAGSDATICSGTTHTLNGTISGSATSSTWTTSGSGTFDNASSLTATYTPSPADITMGTVTLTLTTNDPAGPCPAVSDAMMLTINAAATVSAGADAVICQGNTYTLAGSFGGGASAVTWTTSGSGTFSNPNSPTATYTPSAADITMGSVILTLTTNDPAGPCPSVADQMVLTINPSATVNAGADDTICSGTTYTLSGTIGGSATSATWTTSGSGTFDNASSLTATYTPSPADITMGTVTLTLTTNDPDLGGPCPAVNDAMVLTINPAATVNAGADAVICQGSNYSLNGSFGGGATSVTWTTSGSGTFSNSNSPTATYTPSAADIAAGTVTLTLTTNDPDGAGPCPVVSDQMILTINPEATVSAGVDAIICSGTTYTLSGSIGGSATSAAWTTSGSGTFDNASSLTATYTSSPADITMGTVALTLTTNDPDGAGPCPAVSDQMILTINPAATVNAGTDGVICEGSTYTLSGSIGGSASSALWTTSGSGAFMNPAMLNTTYIPSAGDIAMGGVMFTLTTNDPDGAGPCPAVSDQMILTINPAATVNAGADDTICAGDTYTLSGIIGGSATSATWSSSGTGTFDNPTLLTATYTPSPADITMGSVTLILVTNDPDGAGPCNAVFDQMLLTINPFVIADAGPDASFCSGDTVQIGSPPFPDYFYSWSPATGLSDPTLSNPLLTLTNVSTVPDTYLYVVSVNDTVTTCSSSDSVIVIVRPYPITDAGNDTGFCSGQSVIIGTSSTAGYTYSWSPDTGLSDTSVSDPLVFLTNSDTIIDTIFYAVVTTVYNCSASDSMQVLVYPLPIVDGGPDIFFCSGNSDTLGSPPIVGYTYLWSPATGLSDSSSAQPVVTLTNPSIINDTTIYILTVTSIFGCIDMDTVLVIVNHLPLSDAGPDVAFCSGFSDTLGTTATAGYFYSWVPSSGLSDTAVSDPVVTLLNTDTINDTSLYIVTATVGLCSTSDSVLVVVYGNPPAEAGNPVAFCSADTAQIGSSPRPDKIYQWNPLMGLSNANVSNPLLTLTNTGPGFDSLPYVVIVTDTITGCIASDTVLVVVFPLPATDTINGGISVCPGASGVWYWINSVPGSSFQWSLSGGGTIVSGQGNDTVIVDWGIVPGIYVVSAVETDSNSCTGDTSSLSVKIQYTLEPPAPEGLDSICDRYLTGYYYQTDYVTGSQYSWYITWGTFTTPNDTNYVYSDWDSVGIGLIWYEEANTTVDTVCSGVSDTLFVNIFKSPVATVINGGFVFCEDTLTAPYSINGLAGSTFTWYVNGDTVASGVNLDSINLVWDSAGIFEITVSEITVNNCMGWLRDTVTVYKTPNTSAISGDTSICYYPSDTFLYSVSGLTGSTYQWIVTGGSVVSTPPGNDSALIVWDTIGSWNITVIEISVDSCIGSPVSLNVNTWQVPVASGINGVFVFCEDSVSYTYSINSLMGATVTWLLNGDTVSSAIDNDSVSFVWDSAGTFVLNTYEITVNGCIDSLYDTVTVYKTPSTSAITGDTSICFYPSDTQLYYVTGLPGSSYQWIVTGGSVVSFPPDDDSVLIVWDSVGSWNITVIETSIDSCIGALVTLSGNTWQVPVASGINGAFIFCEDSTSYLYTVNSLPGSTVTWFLNGDSVSSAVDNDSAWFVWDSAGTFVISTDEITVNGCIDSLYDTVVVHTTPSTSAITGETSICFYLADTHLYYVSGLPGSSYQWTVTGGSVVNAPPDDDSVLVVWDTISPWNITVIETSADSCIGVPVSLSGNTWQVPVAYAINGIFEFCDDSIQWLYTISSLPGSTVTWFLNGDTVSFGVDNDSVSLVWDSAGTFVLSTRETTVNGCTDSLDTIVIVYKTPNTSSIAGDTSICFYTGDQHMYYVNGLPWSTYQWIVTGGSVVSLPADADTVMIVWDTITSWSITVIETSVDSCVGVPVSLSGNTWQVPTASQINGSFIFCEDSLSSIYTVNSLPGSTVTWFLNGDSVSSGMDNDSVSFVWDSAGVFALSSYEISVNGCVDSLYDTVTVYKTPSTSAIYGDTSLCFYTADTQLYYVTGLPGSSYQWIVTGGSVVSFPPDDDSVLVVWDTVSTGNITVIETSVDSCIGAPVTLNINTWQVPVASGINGSFVFCEDSLSYLYTINSLNGSTVTWFLNGDSVSSAVDNDSILFVWDSAGTFFLSAYETTVNGCIDSLFDTVTVYETPSTSAIIGDTSICFYPSDTQLYYVTGLPGSSYQWIITGGSVVSSPPDDDSVLVVWDSAGAGNITVIETSADSCIGAPVSLNVNTWQVPSASNINGSFALCEDSLLYLYTVSSLPGSTITWLLNGDTVSSGIDNDSISFVWDSAGTFILKEYEVTINGCIDSLSDTVMVYEMPSTSAIIGDPSICFYPADTHLYYVTGLGGSTYQWLVTGGSIVSIPPDNDSVLVVWDSAGAWNISVIETAIGSCIGTPVSLNVNVWQVPAATGINGSFIFCEDSVSYLYSINSLPGSLVTWFLNGDTVSAGIDNDSVLFIWDSEGIYAISVVETTGSGCSDSLYATVIVYEAPSTSAIAGDTSICFYPADTHLYYVTGLPGSTYQWVVTGGTIVSPPPTDDSLLVIWDSVVIGNITVIETSVDSCLGAPVSLNVIIWQVPFADSIYGIMDLCQGKDTFTYLINGLPGSYYLWDIPGATAVIDDSSNTVAVVWDNPGTWNVGVVEIAPGNCPGDTVDTMVTVNPKPLTSPIFGPPTVCPPLNNGQMYFVMGYDGSYFTWSVTGGVIASGQGNDTIFINWDTTGPASVSVTELTKDSCTGDTVVSLNVILDSPGLKMLVVTDQENNDRLIDIKWEVINNLGFTDSLTVFRRTHFSGFSWDSLARVKSADVLYTDQNVLTHNYSYEYFLQSRNACNRKVATNVHNSILLKATPDEKAKTIGLKWNKYVGWYNGVNRYEIWRKMDDETMYSFYEERGADTSVIYTNGKDGFVHCFRVLAFENNVNEISWSNDTCVTFRHQISVPNVITPNGNGYNDTWKIDDIDMYPECEVEIYNRWGEKLFYSKGYTVQWDGTYNGKDLPVGTYYYLIDLNDGDEVYKGNVTIIRDEK